MDVLYLHVLSVEESLFRIITYFTQSRMRYEAYLAPL